jgi:exodeoxyribonuclease VIII
MTYQENPAVNPSSLKILYKESPAHYRWALTHPREESDAMRIGTAFHTRVLEPHLFNERYVVKPAGMKFSTKDGMAWRADAEAAGMIILTETESVAIEGMAASLLSSPQARKYLANGAIETPLYWTDPETGIECKGRPDLVTESGLLVDLKKARSINQRRFGAQAMDLGYIFSMAMYHDALELRGQLVCEVVFAAVEGTGPFDCGFYRMTDEHINLGRDQYSEALQILKRCRDEDYWPGQVPDVTDLTLPAWAWPEEEDAEGLDFGEGD